MQYWTYRLWRGNHFIELTSNTKKYQRQKSTAFQVRPIQKSIEWNFMKKKKSEKKRHWLASGSRAGGGRDEATWRHVGEIEIIVGRTGGYSRRGRRGGRRSARHVRPRQGRFVSNFTRRLRGNKHITRLYTAGAAEPILSSTNFFAAVTLTRVHHLTPLGDGVLAAVVRSYVSSAATPSDGGRWRFAAGFLFLRRHHMGVVVSQYRWRQSSLSYTHRDNVRLLRSPHLRNK